MKILFGLLLLLGLSAIQNESKAQTYYVSPNGNDLNSGFQPEKPFANIQKAVDEIRKSGKQSNPGEFATILLMGGTYELKQPLIIKPVAEGSAKQPMLIDRYQNQPVILSGGREMKGWKKQKNGWWITTIPEVAAQQWKFNQLFVNGVSRPRARKPNSGFLRVKGMPDGTPKTTGYSKASQKFEYGKGDINPKWTNLGDAEVIVYHFWTDTHVFIKSIDEKNNLVSFTHPSKKVFADDFNEEGARYVVENVLEELDAPGEWYLDRKTGKLSYFPFPGEKPEDVTFFAPVLPELVRLDGDPENRQFVEDITFRNIEFRYTNFQLPEGDTNNGQGSSTVSASVTLKGARNCEFTNCKFTQLGTWAFDLEAGCVGNRFKNNQINHIAAGGFKVNGGTFADSPFLRTARNVFTDNEIGYYGQKYPSAVGILLQQTEGNYVAHNLIHDGFYTGISVGWVWNYERSISRDNVIEFNHIHHIGQGLLSDMGGIYTLGVSPGTVLRNNLIHDVDANRYGGWGIYNDEGSTHILVENNIVYNTKFAGYNIHFAKELTVRNNIFALGRLQQLNRDHNEPHQSVYFENNIIFWKEGVLLDTNWKDEPYTFYYHPDHKEGKTLSSTFEMDRNLYFNPSKSLSEIDFNGKSWAEWQKAGKDIHSQYADPMFVDAAHFNFTLKPGSPAFKLGFNAIDMSSVGPRGLTGPKM
jgi:hypothetical protein